MSEKLETGKAAIGSKRGFGNKLRQITTSSALELACGAGRCSLLLGDRLEHLLARLGVGDFEPNAGLVTDRRHGLQVLAEQHDEQASQQGGKDGREASSRLLVDRWTACHNCP